MRQELLLELAKLCEDALCSSRQLDADIWRAIPDHSANGDKSNSFYAPRYTMSLDDAASLIPDGYDWILERVNSGMTICARVGHNDPDRTSWGETPALALAAASLRARAAAIFSKVREEGRE